MATLEMAKASNDSDEQSDRITSADLQQQQPGGSNRQPAEQLQVGSPERSGHSDPKTRRLFLILVGISCSIALAGLLLLLTWVYKFRPTAGFGITNPDQLGNIHPVMMYIFMVSLNMYATLVYRICYSWPKGTLKWIHASMSGANIVMSVLGVYAMFRAHQIAGIANFYSLHSWCGSLTVGLMLSQFLVGYFVFLRPGAPEHLKASLMPYHRALGAGILISATIAAVTGVLEWAIFHKGPAGGTYSQFGPITWVANLIGVCVLAMAAISVYQLRAGQYQRPRLPEEEPLKR